MKLGDVWRYGRTNMIGKVTEIDKINNSFTVSWQVRIDDICQCECHEEWKEIMHIIPCCHLCSHKYITNGMVDFIKYFSAGKFDIVKRNNR